MRDIRPRTGYLFLALMVGHVILISAQVRSSSGMRLLDSVVFAAFSEVQRGAATVMDSTRGVWDRYVALRDTESENERLHREILRLSVRLQEEHALAQRSRQLEQLLDTRAMVPVRTEPATIIAADPTLWFQTVTINKGSGQGIRPDLAVLSAEGVVGRVLGEVAPRAARVQLLIDRNAAVGALIERTRVAGIVHGGGSELPMLMEYVSKLADVQVADRIVTSGIDGIYPKGFLIGYVASTAPQPGLYQRIEVRPAVDFSALEDVLVVLGEQPAPDEEGSSG